MQNATVILRAALAAVVLGLGGGGGFAAEPVAPVSGEAWAATREETFDKVWQTVNESYFDPTFGGVDWAMMRDKYRPRLAAAADNPALRVLLQEMLGELRKTHFSIMPREMSFSRPRNGAASGRWGRKWPTPTGVAAISELEEGSAARAAGLNPGDVIPADR